ncbi:MAG TPA: hypothetical protein VHA37_05245 [Candidatus Saccharimonadales bacterium]|nr:hypothetical protein [Candidatus Saccharimonadales bacterium]
MRLGQDSLRIGCFGLVITLPLAGALARAQSRRAVEAAEAAACGPYASRPHAKFVPGNGEVEPPPAGKARVYVIDVQPGPASFMEDGLSVGMDGQWLGALNGRSQLSVNAEPGEHHFCIRVEHSNGGNWRHEAQRVALLLVRVNAGETAFLAVKAQFPDSETGLWHGLIRRINHDEGRLLLATAKQSVAKGGH